MLDQFDIAMMRLACRRGTVYVQGDDGLERVATLVSWRGNRNGRRQAHRPTARVEFLDGRRYTLPTDRVRPLEPVVSI